MEALAYFILWAGLFFLMMRFGCGAHVLGHGHGTKSAHQDQQSENTSSQLRWSAPETATDPACKRTVQTATAKSSVHDGRVYYFCTRECRERFEAAPDNYLADFSDNADSLEEPTHV